NLSVVSPLVPWWRDDAYYAPSRWQGKIALDGGGALMNQAIHTVDLMQWFAAAAIAADKKADKKGSDPFLSANPVEEVFAHTAKRGHDPKLIEVEDTAVALPR